MTAIQKTVSTASISWNETGKPFSNDYQDIYYSKSDALAESSFVFLEANQLASRWKELKEHNFILGECGFGGGLNFLNTCRLWCQSAPSDSTLHYLACELHPFIKTDLQLLHQAYPELQAYSEVLLSSYPPLYPGIHQRELIIKEHRIVLTLAIGDATQMLYQLRQENGFRVDAWFLDGFSPALNPKMWDKELCMHLAALSKDGATLSTYSAAALIKNSLQENGFRIERKSGFAGKRHMLYATFNSKRVNFDNNHEPLNARPVHFQLPINVYHKKNALVIGAGLAGCSSAHALAKSGWQVTLVEREASIASQASGNSRGVVNCKLSNSREASAEYYLHSFFYALNYYRQLAKEYKLDWDPCGVLQLAYDSRELTRQSKAVLKRHINGFVQQLDTRSASKIARIKLDHAGLFFPDTGYINPQALCHAYTQHPGISCLTHTEALLLNSAKQGWEISGSNGFESTANVVIIANSQDALKFEQSCHYPLLRNFGQIDQFASTESSQSLACILSAKAYILPAAAGIHSIGGSTSHDSKFLEISKANTQKNLKLLHSISADIANELSSSEVLQSRSGTRCNSPDYLPLVGPVENKELCQEIYKQLGRNARKEINEPPVHQAGLFINVGHGSHGLTSTPLAAEYLAGMINNTVLPLANTLINCLHPMRFLISKLKQQK
tara:strand:- start:133516 stop:135528 length:2013 start_codon:yes stop_codon:yes gene_type:complete